MTTFDSIASRYDSWYETEFGKYADRLEKKLVRELLGNISGKRILEIGCGTGNYAVEFSKGSELYICLDISKEMLKLARSKTKNCNEIHLIRGDGRFLPIKKESIDVIIIITMLEFVDDIVPVIKESKRVLKENGKLIIGILNKYSLYILFEILKGNRTYKNAKIRTIYEIMRFLKEENVRILKWGSTIFVPKTSCKIILNLFEKIDRILAAFFRPLGAFICLKCKK